MEPSIFRMRDRDILALCVLALLCLGVVMVQSASSAVDAPLDVVHLKGQPDTDHPADYTLEGDVRHTAEGVQVVERGGRVHEFHIDDVVSVEHHADQLWQWSKLATRNVTYAGVAVLTFFAVGRLNYRQLGRTGQALWRTPAIWALLVAIGMCALVLVPIPGVTKAVNGARRW